MKTYYVSNSGDDGNSGLSPEMAWASVEKVNAMTFEPGDHVLFHAEGVWTINQENKTESYLKPRGSGSEQDPIIIGKYGTDDYEQRPILNGAGKVINTIHLQNVNDYTIEHLEVTNYDPAGTSSQDIEKELRAIFVENAGIETYTMKHITIQDCYIHDVNARYCQRFNNDGAIIVRVTVSAENTLEKALRFDGVWIRRNTIYDVNYGGIFFRNDNQNRGSMHDGIGPWIGSPNIVIENNSLDRIGGDGIVVSTGIAPLVQYNVVKDSHLMCPDPCAAIWVINSEDALYQYNEAYLTRKDLDGQAYDADGLCERTIFQYNYSHDNEGGFMLICDWHGEEAFNQDGVIRYNISQNDRSKLIHYAGVNTGFKIYNNTFYVGPGNNATFSRDHGDRTYPSDITYNNNIFYNLGTDFTYEHPITQVNFENNIFFGNHPESEPDDPKKMLDDPRLFAPGTGETLFDTPIDKIDFDLAQDWAHLVRSRLKGYQLMPGSPAIGTGIQVDLPKGIAPAIQDFYGNPVDEATPDIGAHAYSEDAPVEVPVGSSWAFVEGYSLVSGANNWHYLRSTKEGLRIMTADSPNSCEVIDGKGKALSWRASQWEEQINGTTGYIGRDRIKVSGEEDLAMVFVVPADGIYSVKGAVERVAGRDGLVHAAIKHNELTVWESVDQPDSQALWKERHDVTIMAIKGDQISCTILQNPSGGMCEIIWQPVVTYERG
ncbi:MAG: right-handed parallel beta-helix repeat-containing protein [Cellulosilyticaceae bacterium]